MATRAVIEFKWNEKETAARIYKHWDGYPEGTLPVIKSFFQEVERQTQDTRFSDAAYLAAKFVVYLSRMYATATDYSNNTTKLLPPLDFLSVGIVNEIPMDVEFVYTIHAANYGEGWPKVEWRGYAQRDGEIVDFSHIDSDSYMDALWARVRETPLEPINRV